MQLPLVPSDDPVLHAKASRIADPTSVRQLAADMIETMIVEAGVGLAAPQIGKSIRLFVAGVDKDYQAYVNPEIVWLSTQLATAEEGCLSLPRLLGDVERATEVELHAFDLNGKKVTVRVDGLLARVFQHELDHLDGILFPERMKDLSKLRKLTQAEWDSRYSEADEAKPE